MKNIRFYLLAVIYILSNTGPLNAQSNCDCYERLFSLSDYLSVQNKHEEALKALQFAISKKEENLVDKYDYKSLALKYFKLNMFEEGFQKLKLAISKGYDFDYIKDDPYFEQLKDSKEWKKFEAEVPELEAIFDTSSNLKYRLALENIRGSDQFIRRYGDFSFDTYNLIDSINFTRFLDLESKYGFPSQAEHGFTGSDVFFLHLHASMYSEDLFNIVYNDLLQASSNCLIKKQKIALFLDRYEVWSLENPQKFGLWNHYEDIESYSTFLDIEKVDKIRFEYNLLRLKESSIVENRKIPNNYISIDYPENYFCGFNLISF